MRRILLLSGIAGLTPAASADTTKPNTTGSRVLLLALLLASALVPIHAAILVPPISGQFPDVFTGYCTSGCLQLGYVSTPNVVDSTGDVTASMTAAVYMDPSNTFCINCLDFVYQVSNNANSADGIGRVTAVSFTGFSTDVGFSPTAPGSGGGGSFVNGTDAPGLVDRNTADVVGFQFSSSPTAAIAPGSTSNLLIIETNATSFTSGFVSIEDGGVATFSAFEPTSGVPEPTSGILLGLGTLALAGLQRFRRSDR